MPHRSLLLLLCLALLCSLWGAGESPLARGCQQPAFKDELEYDVSPVTSKRPKGVDSPVVVRDSRIEGAWGAISAEQNGVMLSEEYCKGFKMIFRNGNLSLGVLGEAWEETYKVNPSKRPMTIDLTMDGKTVEGIFVLREDVLTLCAAEAGEKRPTTFAAPAGSDHMLIVLKRRKGNR